MSQATLTLPVDPRYEAKIRDVLEEADFELIDAPHAFWRGRGPGCVATFYRSGKLVLQGPSARTLAEVLGLDAPAGTDPAEAARLMAEDALALHPDPKPDAWIGSDEVGKGDYFGPLVTVACRVSRTQVPLLLELGVADSKTLKAGKIRQVVGDIRSIVPHRKVVVAPESYNRLQRKLGNVNRMLAWTHARAIEDLLSEAPATYAVVDRFADVRVLTGSLLEAGRAIQVDQRPRAEADPAVAAASLIARVEFLDWMDRLSREAGFTLPRGAGPPVLVAGRRLVAERGADSLERFAKRHFRTTEQVLGQR